MELGFVYHIALRDLANPPGRHREASELVREWFQSSGVNYGMGSLGGSRTIYGTVHGHTEQELAQLRAQFADWLTQLPVCAVVNLGHTTVAEAIDLMTENWERTFEVNNLSEPDRNAAVAYYTELTQRVAARAKKPATES